MAGKKSKHCKKEEAICIAGVRVDLLKIPENFVRRFRDELSVIATVTVPDGNIWSIGLKMADNKCWFHHGWQEFTEHYSLRVGYLLVFRYNGSSAFSVYIFNLNTSEINYESNAFPNSEHTYGNHCQIFEEMEDEDSVETLGLSPPDSLKSKLFGEHEDQRTPGKSSNPHLRLFNGSSFKNCMSWPGSGGNLHAENQSTRDIGVQFSVTDLKKPTKVELPMSEDGRKPSKAGRKKQRVDPNEHTSSIKNEEAELRYRFYESASARKRTVTAEERERAINTAKIFEPPNPFCRVVLRPSYLYRGCIMYLPSCFAEKNLCGVSGFIKLQISDGRQWPVRCLYKGGRAKFSQGWYEFCLENKLGEGDVCVFELLTMRDVVLKVTMFRVLEDVEPRNQPLPQMVSQNRLIRN